jgi:hypothetical protein
MGRNVAIQVLRGIAANIPSLNNGEFYLATDTGQLYVGLFGINFRLGAPVMASVEINGNANPTHFIEPNADGSIVVEAPGGAALALDGTDNTGVSQPNSGVGIRGWLSAIYSKLLGSIAVTGTFWQATQPVSGTFFQATQPVSAASLPLPSNAAQETGGNLAVVASQMPAATAKGTQAATFGNVQQPKDTGRTKVILTLTKVASITTEALVTLTQKKGDAATTTGTSYTVTSGKTLRIQSILLSATLTAATLTAVAVRLREGAASGGTLALTSDIISELEVSANVATIGASGQQALVFPDGLELTGGQQIGVSELASSTSAAVTLVITGYEY